VRLTKRPASSVVWTHLGVELLNRSSRGHAVGLGRWLDVGREVVVEVAAAWMMYSPNVANGGHPGDGWSTSSSGQRAEPLLLARIKLEYRHARRALGRDARPSRGRGQHDQAAGHVTFEGGRRAAAIGRRRVTCEPERDSISLNVFSAASIATSPPSPFPPDRPAVAAATGAPSKSPAGSPKGEPEREGRGGGSCGPRGRG